MPFLLFQIKTHVAHRIHQGFHKKFMEAVQSFVLSSLSGPKVSLAHLAVIELVEPVNQLLV